MAVQNARSRLLSGSGMIGRRSRRRRTLFPDPVLHVREHPHSTGQASAPAGVAVDELVESVLHETQPLEEPIIDDLCHTFTS
jgi:hypothetical protein